MLNWLASLKEDFVQLFYPHLCLGCADENLSANAIVCPFCFTTLPRTNFADIPDNPTEKIFYGRLPIKHAYSEFYFEKDSIIQHLLHQLKYKSKTDIGEYIGELMGESMSTSCRFKDVDAIIAMPLHKAKLKKRGYNQSLFIANGIGRMLGKPVIENNIERIKNTATQTKKQRDERWQNVAYGFRVKNPESIKNKHLLLVDDVITTGASIESCGRALLEVEDVKVSVASAALTV